MTKLTFGVSILRQSDGSEEHLSSEEGLILEMLPSLSFYGGNLTLINMFDNNNFLR